MCFALIPVFCFEFLSKGESLWFLSSSFSFFASFVLCPSPRKILDIRERKEEVKNPLSVLI